jgi:hypothetical protein
VYFWDGGLTSHAWAGYKTRSSWTLPPE